jgi:hypothetical protein
MRHMIEVGFFVSPGHQMFDRAGPLCAFQNAAMPSDEDAYRLRISSEKVSALPCGALIFSEDTGYTPQIG